MFCPDTVLAIEDRIVKSTDIDTNFIHENIWNF